MARLLRREDKQGVIEADFRARADRVLVIIRGGASYAETAHIPDILATNIVRVL